MGKSFSRTAGKNRLAQPSILLPLLFILGCTSTPGSHMADPQQGWKAIDGIPERFWGGYNISHMENKDGERQKAEVFDGIVPTFLIANRIILPTMYPEAMFKIISVELEEKNTNRIRVLSHTANQPAQDATYLFLTITGENRLWMDFDRERVVNPSMKKFEFRFEMQRVALPDSEPYLTWVRLAQLPTKK